MHLLACVVLLPARGFPGDLISFVGPPWGALPTKRHGPWKLVRPDLLGPGRGHRTVVGLPGHPLRGFGPLEGWGAALELWGVSR